MSIVNTKISRPANAIISLQRFLRNGRAAREVLFDYCWYLTERKSPLLCPWNLPHRKFRYDARVTSFPQSTSELGDRMGYAIARHMEQTFRGAFTRECVVAEERFIRLLTLEPHPLGNFAFVNEASDLEGVRVAEGPLQTAPVSTMLFKSAPSPEVHEFLIGQGYAGPSSTPAMAVDLDRLAATTLPLGYEFVRLGAGSDGEAWVDVLTVAFKLPRRIAEICSPLTFPLDGAPDARLQCFAVLKGGQTVATSLMFFSDGLAGIYNVATLPEERGKGLGAHITAEPLRRAQALGYRVGILQASPAGLPVYRRLGFSEFGSIPTYARKPA